MLFFLILAYLILQNLYIKSLQTLTVQFAAQQLQSEAQALGGGSLWVDPDEAGQEGSH